VGRCAEGCVGEIWANKCVNTKAIGLCSVPGTTEASDAVLLAQIPQTAIVNKAEVETKVKVTYDGDPKFAAIEQTSLQYATNTADKVIKVRDLWGESKEYYGNGKLKTISNYLHGKQNGLTIQYDQTGNIIETKNYSDGNLIDK
jgi:hypothetical protein